MNNEIIKILFIGDIVGKPGRRAVEHFLPIIKKEEGIDLVIANGENMASGKGMTYNKYREVLAMGVDYFTSGNHIWNNKDIIPYLDRPEIKILRPANYQSSYPGKGWANIEISGEKITIISLQGRVFMKDDIEDPFIISKNIIDENKDNITIIDFHAEATSEKAALAYYLDGKATAVLGTHTHVQTADESILPEGTAFISDVGMTGPKYSVLGVKKEIIIEKFLTQLPLSHKVANGDCQLNAVVLTINRATHKAEKIERITNILKV